MTYRIVVGIDGSEHSNAALRWALKEAECHSGTVTAVVAWQVPFLSFPGGFDRNELEKAYKNFVIETVSAIAPKPAVPLETLVAEGAADRVAGRSVQGREPAGARNPRPVAVRRAAARLGEPGGRGDRSLSRGSGQGDRSK